MSNWTYKFKDYTLQLEEESKATYEGEAPDLDYLHAEIDAEVHRLTELIQVSEREIYKLRKWQRVMK